MKRLITLFAVLGLVLALAPAAQAALIKVDNNSAGVAPDTTWNVIDPPATTATSVVDSSGNNDGVTVTYAGWNDSSSFGREGAYDGGVFDNAADDYFFINAGSSATVTISGLLDIETYTIQLCNSSQDSGRVGDYVVNGSFGDGASPFNGDDHDATVDGFVNGTIMTYSGVTPSSGEIVITTTTVSGIAVHLNAFTIEGEPSAGTLIIVK
jgi:hypothetical protein